MINYGGGQSALYTYLASATIKLFGLNLFAVRLPALILSSISMIIFYFMVKDFKNKKLAMLAVFLIAIAPWHFMQSRWGLDCNLMSSMVLISTYLLLKAKGKIGYVISGFFFGLTLYSYALSYIIIPIMLIGLFIYLLWIRKIKIRYIILFAIPFVILAVPLILNLLVNQGLISPISNEIFSTPKLLIYRGAEISFSNVLKNIFPIFKCMFGYDSNDCNAFPIFGTLYYISIPFFVIGIIKIVKEMILNISKKEYQLDTIFLILFSSVFIGMLFVDGLGINKINAIYIPMIYIIAIGIYETIKRYKFISVFIIGIYLLMFALFQYYYFAVYGSENLNISFNQDIMETVQYVESKFEFSEEEYRFY